MHNTTKEKYGIFVAVLLMLLGSAGLAMGPGGKTSEPSLEITFTPAAPDAQGNVGFLGVTLIMEGVRADAGQSLLRLPTVVANVETIAMGVEDLVVRDARGVVPMVARVDAPAGPTANRNWLVQRAVEGRIEVRYRAPITNAPNPLGAAPPLELRTEDGGFSGSASTFLLLPPQETGYRTRIHWDFSNMPAGAVGMSTFGVGDVHPDGVVAKELLQQSYFFGGTIHRYPEQPAASGFFSAWQGTPPFDADALMHWTRHLYDFYFGFFRPGKTRPYAVLLRRNPINAGGGVEVAGSFVGTFGSDTKVAPLKMTLAHEMVHTFVGALETPKGEDDGMWFSEGIAVYYERLLPLRDGQISPAAFLEDLNSTAARYFTNALIHTPNDEIAAKFWTDTRVRVLPYDRGSMYFAVVDHQVRTATGGKRSLDDLIFAMLDRRRRGLPMDEAAWVALVQKELGDAGPAEFEAMLAGKTMLPASDAFGPCFARTTKPLRRYQLGFDSAVLVEPTRIVRGLEPGSAAEKAGLRNGDQIVAPVAQDGIQADQTALLHLVVRRDGKVFPLSYLPRGETVEAYQWVRVPNVPDSACVLPFRDAVAATR